MILAEDLGNTPLVDIESKVNALVEKWRAEGCRFTARIDRLGRELNRKAKPISDAGLNERLKILRSILGHAFLEARLLPVRPRIPMLKKKRAAIGAAKPVRYFTTEESVRFLRYSVAGIDDVFQVGKLLGLRPDELFHARVGWVDFKQSKVFVQTGPCARCSGGQWLPKTGRHRGVDICPDLLPILRRLTKGKPDDALLIEGEHGRPYWRRVGSGGRFTRTLVRAGLDRKGLSIYSLRHTFAADLISAGKSMQEIAALLGNSVRVCELHYGHLRPDVTRETVKVLKAIQPWAPAATPTPARRRTRKGTAEPAATASTAEVVPIIPLASAVGGGVS
jgi:integrase